MPKTRSQQADPTEKLTPLANSKLTSTVIESSSQIQTINILMFIDISKGGIDSLNVDAVEKEIAHLPNSILYLVIHTYGGDVYSSVRIIRILQRKYPTIKVLIPEIAFSSGTVMALGGNEIYMDQDSMLGPLDLPVEHPTDGSMISSLDITKILSNISAISASTGMQIYKELRKEGNTRLGKQEAAEIAFKTSSKILEPILSKIDPYILQKGYREQDIGWMYAYQLLKSRLMSTNSLQAARTSTALVNDYPSHGYGIFRDEANLSLMLNVKKLEDLKEWNAIQGEFEKVKKNTYLIRGISITL